ncbi:hypothetical protein D9M73_168230 [compost metagenome]
MAEEGAVGVHVGDQVKVGLGEQLLDHCVVGLQAVDHAFHEPFGHVLARVLLGNQPQLALAFGTVACPQQRDVAALDTAAAGQQLDTRELAGPFDQLVVAGTRVGLEIGEPDLVLFSLDLER